MILTVVEHCEGIAVWKKTNTVICVWRYSVESRHFFIRGVFKEISARRINMSSLKSSGDYLVTIESDYSLQKTYDIQYTYLL